METTLTELGKCLNQSDRYINLYNDSKDGLTVALYEDDIDALRSRITTLKFLYDGLKSTRDSYEERLIYYSCKVRETNTELIN